MPNLSIQRFDGGLKSKLYSFDTLPQRVLNSWHELQASNPKLYSPYFHPDYTKAVSRLRNDIKIAVLERDNVVIAILPFQGHRHVQPVGAPMTDYHGVICRPGFEYSIKDILKPHHIGVYSFDALISEKSIKTAKTAKSAVIEFPNGSNAWLSAQGSAFTKHQKETRRRLRKASSEIGTPRFIPLSQNLDEFDKLIEWKTTQYANNKLYNVLGVEWTLNLLKSLLKTSETLRLDMHALYFGDALAAVDTGLSDGTTYHRWIVSYSPKFHTYAPGTQILNHIISASDALGYKRIDHGVGTESFKKYYATEDVFSYVGYTNISALSALATSSYDCVERFGSKHLNDTPGKLRRRYHQISGCETGLLNKQKALALSIRRKMSPPPHI